MLSIGLRWSFENTLASEVRVRIQESIAIPSQSSVPEPDIAWVRSAAYHAHRPSAEDVLLIIEVAKSSAKVDLGEKGVIYAAAGIADYWVANIETKSLVVHRDPVDGHYTRIVSHDGNNSVQTLAKPKGVLDVAALYSFLS